MNILIYSFRLTNPDQGEVLLSDVFVKNLFRLMGFI